MPSIILFGVMPTAIFEALLGLNLLLAMVLTIILLLKIYRYPTRGRAVVLGSIVVFMWWQLMIIGPLVALGVLVFLRTRKNKLKEEGLPEQSNFLCFIYNQQMHEYGLASIKYLNPRFKSEEAIRARHVF